MGPHEHLRFLVGVKGADYVIYWALADDQRSLEFTGCCCGGAAAQILQETSFITHASTTSYLDAPKCPDNSVHHSNTKICDFLMQMPLSIPLDSSGPHAQVLVTGQPRWVNLSNSDACSSKEVSQAKVYVPMPAGLTELGLSNQAMENPSLIQLVLEKCGDIWLGNNVASNALIEPASTCERTLMLAENQFSSAQTGGGNMSTLLHAGAGMNAATTMIVSMPGSPLIPGFGKELQGMFSDHHDKTVKKLQSNGSSVAADPLKSNNYVLQQPHYQTNSSGTNGNGSMMSQLPWMPFSNADQLSWQVAAEHDQQHQLHEDQNVRLLNPQQLNSFSNQMPAAATSNQAATAGFSNQKQPTPTRAAVTHHDNIFEGIGDSLSEAPRPTTMQLSCDQQSFADNMMNNNNNNHIIINNFPGAAVQKSSFTDSPHASGLSKEVSDRDVKQEIRTADSSDCSDQIEDDEENVVSAKGTAPRSGRRHLSKNLVAERKRRKKLNERLYSLRALVPKITKMDRASILGDAIEYVKELQQQVKELQEELLETKDEDMQQHNHSHAAAASTSLMQQQDHHAVVDGSGANQILEDSNGINMQKGDEFQCTLKPVDGQSCCKNNICTTTDHHQVQRSSMDELNPPMQVEVSEMDGRIFGLRIFCEKKPGVFVKLMQTLDVLGLDILHANITTFRGLVLNIFNAEIRDKKLLQAEQVKESLMEMASFRESRSGCVITELPLEKD